MFASATATPLMPSPRAPASSNTFVLLPSRRTRPAALAATTAPGERWPWRIVALEPITVLPQLTITWLTEPSCPKVVASWRTIACLSLAEALATSLDKSTVATAWLTSTPAPPKVTPSGMALERVWLSQGAGPVSSALTTWVVNLRRSTQRLSGTKEVRVRLKKYRFCATKAFWKEVAESKTPSGSAAIRHCPAPSVASDKVSSWLAPPKATE